MARLHLSVCARLFLEKMVVNGLGLAKVDMR